MSVFCSKCPVTSECGDWAEEIDAEYGIWGGKKRNKKEE